MPSRLFSGGYISHASAIVSAYPWSMFVWVKPATGASGVDTIFSAWNAAGTNTGWAIENNSGKAAFRSSLSGTAPTATVATAFTAEVWAPVLAMAASATSRTIYAITRSNSATNTTSNTPTSITRTAWGTRFTSAVPEYNFVGQMAHPTLWNIANFSNDEIDALFAGADPMQFRPGSILAAPTLYDDSPELDLVAARSWTVTGTTTKEDGPPVWRLQRTRRRSTATSSSAGYLNARISSGDTWYDNKLALAAGDKGKMAVAIVTLNSADQSVSVELNERTAQTEAQGVTFNTQTGSLFLGCDLVNGAVQDAGSEKARLHTVRVFSQPFDDETRESVLDAIADDLTPVTTPYSGEVSSTAATDVDLTDFVKDPSGHGWSVTAAEVADEGCTAAVSGKKVTITPLGGEGTTSVTATITNNWMRPRSKSLLMSLSKVEGEEEAAPTDVPSSWTWSIPWLPTSNDDIDVYQIQTNGTFKRTVGSTTTTYSSLAGLGSSTKVALLVAPTTAITGGLAARNMKYRGVVLAGATFRYVGTNLHYWVGVTNQVRWGHVLNFSFDGAYMDERPFLFIANIDYQSTDSKGGDFLRMGTTGSNRDKWCDTYVQRVKIGVGNYFGNLDNGTDAAPKNPKPWQDSQGPHSDFMQSGAYGQVNNFYIANCDVKWAGQIFFHRPESGDVIIGSSSDIRNVTVRPMPHDSVIQSAKPHAAYKIVDFVDGDKPSSPAAEYAAGRYHAFKFTKCLAMEDPDSKATGLGSYFDSSGLTTVVNTTAKTVSWSPEAKSPNTLKPATGSWKFETNPADAAGTIIGSKYRITTAAALRTAAGL